MAQSTSRIIVQCDWDHVLRQKGGKAWVSFREPGKKSVYGEVRSDGMRTNEEYKTVVTEGFTVDSAYRRHLTLSYCDDDQKIHRCRFQAPDSVFSKTHNAKKNVLCMDVTPGGLGVSCDTEGKLKVWVTESGEVRLVHGKGEHAQCCLIAVCDRGMRNSLCAAKRTATLNFDCRVTKFPQVKGARLSRNRDLVGHYGDVYCCRFFPSGIVILSGGADTQLRIWSAEDGQCAATLAGHKAGILDLAIVERGRNVVSVSRDGTAKLWDCGRSSCLITFDDVEGGVINGCHIGMPSSDCHLGHPDVPPGEREILTEGKLLLLACENKSLKAYGLHSRKKVFSSSCSGPVNCCTFLSDHLVICGTDDSHVNVIDTRNTNSFLASFDETRSAILSLQPYKEGCFISTGDGSCYFLDKNLKSGLELTGSDCDPLYRVVTDGRSIYTCCRDGAIRRYHMQGVL